ncbi:hypothetical protein DICSQDRAFT_102012 [Dichomitus squalens LYAD-421 SS1]|uniref:uncharacterized protein n=1 Tax=Dichomitus squalens (strain LYAD-421) TaxID=732165 RepID=UPI00044146BA|nr:uncharacterized protein DICSQDRAFT_102012 [Dichomitus squalens LYAD-421 SS1]EJF63876.1 hypothetical protein DICSQDRAFT_102012 [Dichomitus squalens LYAD-421 SS1]
MGVFALAIPGILLGERLRHHTQDREYDPEKAVRHDSRPSGDLDRSSHDILSPNTPHRRARRVCFDAKHPTSANGPGRSTVHHSDDLPKSTPSMWRKAKDYVWPSAEQLADLDTFVPNYRWTPILSGIIIPFSILLEIPGLTEKWYIKTEGTQIVAVQKNPIILEVGLAISMASAVIANVALILRFLEKRVKSVTLLCVAFLTLHDVINIIVVTTFGVEHRFDDGFTYGEAFWMTLCSTIVSSVTNVTLIVDFVRTPDFAKRGSGLTRRQRSLVIIVIILLVYIAFCALLNSVILELSFINGLYFTVVSIETIGFGDIVPESTGGKVWTCIFVSLGILLIGLAIAMCRETILEGLEIGYRRRVRKMREHRRETRRFRRWEARWRRAVEFRLREMGLPVWVPDKPKDEGAIRVFGVDTGVKMPFYKRVGTHIKRTATITTIASVDSVLRRNKHRKMHLNVEALRNVQLEEAALEAGVPLEMFSDLGARPELQRSEALGTNAMEAQKATEGTGVGPTVQATLAAATFHDSIASGWVHNPETPTHAQLGRMAAMLTKFSLAVSGHHAHPPALPHSEYVQEANLLHPHAPPPHDPSEEEHRRPTHGNSFEDIRRHPAAKWLRDFTRGANQRSTWTYEKLKEDMEQEERKAYWAKLTIAWSLLILFWTIGSGIFCATEGWTYGEAMYFCFVAFSTTGYGDYSPKTPAGRSVFVVWALFGVGTLTILISVLQEAGSYRYKNALHSRVFDNAVKNYRKRLKQTQDSKRNRMNSKNTGAGPGGVRTAGLQQQNKPTFVRLREADKQARRALEALPNEIIRSARTLHDYMEFFVSGVDGLDTIEEGDVASGTPNIPPDMTKLLDELGDMEGINPRLKAEILQDEDARKTLFMLSLERSMKRLVAHAETAMLALSERDALVTATGTEHAHGVGLQHLDWTRRKNSDGRIRAQSEPPSVTPRRIQEDIPRTVSEGSSILNPRDRLGTCLSQQASHTMRNRDRAASSASSSSTTTSSYSNPMAS